MKNDQQSVVDSLCSLNKALIQSKKLLKGHFSMLPLLSVGQLLQFSVLMKRKP